MPQFCRLHILTIGLLWKGNTVALYREQLKFLRQAHFGFLLQEGQGYANMKVDGITFNHAAWVVYMCECERVKKSF